MGTNENQNIGERVGYVDGLRGLAIFLVAMGHIFYEYYLFKIGWIGLNLFFILSGYLITQRLYVHLKGTTASYFKNFYGRRILRIFPLYYGWLFFFFIVLPFFYNSYSEFYGGLHNAQGWFWTYTSNWWMGIHGIPDEPSLFHFWSLAVEEQFYIIWPFLFLLLIRIKKAPVFIIGLIFVSLFMRNFISENISSYLSTSTAAEPLLLGSLVAVFESQKKIEQAHKYFFILAILSAITLIIIFVHSQDLHITNDWLLHTGYTAIDILWTYLLVLCIATKQVTNALKVILSAGWLKWLGKYSYGIYVFHWLILHFFVYKFVTELINRGIERHIAYFSVRLAGMAAILFVSYLSYNFYEKRFLTLKKYFT